MIVEENKTAIELIGLPKTIFNEVMEEIEEEFEESLLDYRDSLLDDTVCLTLYDSSLLYIPLSELLSSLLYLDILIKTLNYLR